MKRRILAIIFALVLIFSVGCSKDKATDGNKETSSITSSDTDSSSNEESNESNEMTEEETTHENEDDDFFEDDDVFEDDDFFNDDDEALDEEDDFYTPLGKKEEVERIELRRGINVATLQDGIDNAEEFTIMPETYVLIKSSGFDHVRIPINWLQMLEEESENKISKEYFRHTDMAINAALEAGLAVVIDLHGSESLLSNNVTKYEQLFYDVWEQVAIRYVSYSDNLYFELINESHGTSSSDTITHVSLNRLQNNAIKIIRKYSKTRPICVAPLNWNTAENLKYLEIPSVEEDPNIIVSVHTYAPINFTHQGAWWDPSYANITGVRFDDAAKQAIDRDFRFMAEYIEKTGRKLWLSEFGVALTGASPDEDVSAYCDYIMEQCDKYGVSWCYWEYEGTFGAHDAASETWKDFIYKHLIK